MRILHPNPESIRIALSVLEEGGTVIHPTETCYGLACDLANAEAVARLFLLKARPPEHPVSALFSSVEQVKQYVLWNDEADSLAAKHLPGPLTIILPLQSDAPYRLYTTPTSGERVGVRISSHPVAQELVHAFGRPISTTSANIHGRPPTYDPEEIAAQFSDIAMDLVLLNAGSLPIAPPSTILDLTAGPSPREVRRGGTILGASHGGGGRRSCIARSRSA